MPSAPGRGKMLPRTPGITPRTGGHRAWPQGAGENRRGSNRNAAPRMAPTSPRSDSMGGPSPRSRPGPRRRAGMKVGSHRKDGRTGPRETGFNPLSRLGRKLGEYPLGHLDESGADQPAVCDVYPERTTSLSQWAPAAPVGVGPKCSHPVRPRLRTRPRVVGGPFRNAD